jgi:hypothetical protein
MFKLKRTVDPLHKCHKCGHRRAAHPVDRCTVLGCTCKAFHYFYRISI